MTLGHNNLAGERFSSQNREPVSKEEQARRAESTERIKPWRFQPGVSGNPGGRPAVDLAAEIARALFEQKTVRPFFEAFRKILRKGSPYAFQVLLSDRAYGKLKETHAIEHNPFKGQSDEDLEAQLRELEEKLGYRTPEPKVLPPVKMYGSHLFSASISLDHSLGAK